MTLPGRGTTGRSRTSASGMRSPSAAGPRAPPTACRAPSSATSRSGAHDVALDEARRSAGRRRAAREAHRVSAAGAQRDVEVAGGERRVEAALGAVVALQRPHERRP